MNQKCDTCVFLDKKETSEYAHAYIKHIKTSICTDKTGKHDRRDAGKNCLVYKERTK